MAKTTNLFDNVTQTIKKHASLISSAIVICGLFTGVCTWTFNQAFAQINEKIDKIDVKVDNLEVDSTREQLLLLIYCDPSNHSDILKFANKYFVELGQDWVISETFQEWASKEGVDITRIMEIHDRNSKPSGT